MINGPDTLSIRAVSFPSSACRAGRAIKFYRMPLYFKSILAKERRLFCRLLRLDSVQVNLFPHSYFESLVVPNYTFDMDVTKGILESYIGFPIVKGVFIPLVLIGVLQQIFYFFVRLFLCFSPYSVIMEGPPK